MTDQWKSLVSMDFSWLEKEKLTINHTQENLLIIIYFTPKSKELMFVSVPWYATHYMYVSCLFIWDYLQSNSLKSEDSTSLRFSYYTFLNIILYDKLLFLWNLQFHLLCPDLEWDSHRAQENDSIWLWSTHPSDPYKFRIYSPHFMFLNLNRTRNNMFHMWCLRITKIFQDWKWKCSGCKDLWSFWCTKIAYSYIFMYVYLYYSFSYSVVSLPVLKWPPFLFRTEYKECNSRIENFSLIYHLPFQIMHLKLFKGFVARRRHSWRNCTLKRFVITR